MVERYRTIRIARIALEAKTAFSVGTGRGQGTHDTSVAVDANGLPTLPSTTIKGVLRSAAGHLFSVEQFRDLFGFVEDDKGAPARLGVSWGWCHDSKDRPVIGRLMPMEQDARFKGEMLTDPVLVFLRECASNKPIVRDRVRIDDRGVADDRGKFDRTVVPAGTRFTVELTLDGWSNTDASDEESWRLLLGLLVSGELRFGGAVRSGIGRFEPVRGALGSISAKACKFTLDSDGFKAFRTFRSALRSNEAPSVFAPLSISAISDAVEVRTISLAAADTWRFGGGSDALGVGDADQVPVREPMIEWIAGEGHPRRGDERRVLVPGSSVKGALRHRTAFHYRCRIGDFHDTVEASPDRTEHALAALFGSVKERVGRKGERESGQPGLIIVDDCLLSVEEVRHQVMTHVSIDRFTGGARQGLLFNEQVLVGGRVDLTVRLLRGFQDLEQDLRSAFDDAIDDLQNGRLSLGAASARGHGRFLTASME